jgi:hypothetical protein
MTPLVLVLALGAPVDLPAFDELLRHEVRLKPELVGVHPRVFVTIEELEGLRVRVRGTHREEWSRVLAGLAAMKGDPPPPPGPQERRSQNTVALAIAEVSLAYAVERKPAGPRGAGPWPPSTTSPGDTRTTSRTWTWPRAIFSMRSAGPTTCCTTT